MPSGTKSGTCHACKWFFFSTCFGFACVWMCHLTLMRPKAFCVFNHNLIPYKPITIPKASSESMIEKLVFLWRECLSQLSRRHVDNLNQMTACLWRSCYHFQEKINMTRASTSLKKFPAGRLTSDTAKRRFWIRWPSRSRYPKKQPRSIQGRGGEEGRGSESTPIFPLIFEGQNGKPIIDCLDEWCYHLHMRLQSILEEPCITFSTMIKRRFTQKPTETLIWFVQPLLCDLYVLLHSLHSKWRHTEMLPDPQANDV